MSSTSSQPFGDTLPDQSERISDLFDAHLEAIGDIREIYRERVVLDREYATKLQLIAKKATERKAKTEATFVVGKDPTKTWNAQTLKLSTFNVAYDEIIKSIISTAQDHADLADALTTQVLDVVKTVEKHNEDIKKKEMVFFQKLLSDRDRLNQERMKNKRKYDEECGEVDAYRQKQSRSSEDRHADRVAKQAEQQRNEMLSAKNAYIISLAVDNGAKARFYHDDLPTFENELQMIQAQLTDRFAQTLIQAQNLQSSHLDVLKRHLGAVEKSLVEISPSKDQDLFIEYNIRPFTVPADLKFEPCSNFYDADNMSVEPAPKVFIQNRLAKSQQKLKELNPIISNKTREFDQLSGLVQAYTADRALGEVDKISDKYLDTRHQLNHFLVSETILNVEVETISAALGGDIGAQQPHAFKSSSFSIPTTCHYCNTSIWGLSKQGKTCKSCGISVHGKCELKVPAECGAGASKSVLTVTTKSSSLAPPHMETPTASSFVQSNAVEEEDISYPVARTLFAFDATSQFELSIKEGELVRVLEPDDGSGWVKVQDPEGNDGLVPASYIEHAEEEEEAVQALYAYQARGADEISFGEGELIRLTTGPNGGRSYGEGWWEGVNQRGDQGIFPSNYVKAM